MSQGITIRLSINKRSDMIPNVCRYGSRRLKRVVISDDVANTDHTQTEFSTCVGKELIGL